MVLRHKVFAAMMVGFMASAVGAGCSGVSQATQSEVVTGQESTEATAVVMPSGSDATSRPIAPEELQGTWEATISTGEYVTLEIRPSGYSVRRSGLPGSGFIQVQGDTIVFSSNMCELGKGPYRWAIGAGTLTFTPLEPRDPCGNRIIFLEDVAYTRPE